MPSIVTVNVSQNIAPIPDGLQKTGAFISQGGTTTAPGTLTLLTQLSDLTPVRSVPRALATVTWSGGTVTATTTAPHGYATGLIFPIAIAGVTPAAYNGTYTCTITGASAFTYAKVSDPGSQTVAGTFVPAASAELLSMATTFFGQGASVSVYVLELGPGSVTAGVAALTAYLTANPNTIYSFLVPRAWDANADFLALVADFESTTAKQYFWVTTTLDNYDSYTALMKDVIALVEAPGIPATEFSLAAPFWVALHYAPSTTNKVTPFAFSYLFGVTPYPTHGNNATLTALKNANVNYVGTGAEGGISTAILLWGTTMDGRDFTYWYSVDWVQINIQLSISNAVINGSNNPINPLYYNQDGINRLQAVAARVLSSAVTFGLALGTVVQTDLDTTDLSDAIASGAFAAKAVVNAVPFVPYASANPSDYRIGLYAGLAAIYIPARGFIHIIFNLNVTDFVTV
ncbi:MAG: hypothetical protein WDN25_13405 [Acetobacteraceae bacterium]